MKRFMSASAAVAAIAFPAILQMRALGQTAAGKAPAETGPDQARTMVTTYCVTCHNARLKTGGLVLEGLDPAAPADDAQIWEKALRKLRGHQMPPPGAPQPSQKDVDSFVVRMENTLDSHAADPHAQGPKAGYVPIQRLNRAEYAATVRALVGVEVNEKEVLPQDIQVDGFDDIADALSVSPAFLDQYVTAARHVARLAVGNPNPRVTGVKYSVAASQNPANPLPPGTIGGIRFTHNFPADGEYRINIRNLGVGPYTASLENESTLVIMIDGGIVFRKPIGGPADQALADRQAGTGRALIMERFSKIPVQVEAGTHDVVVAFIDGADVESDENFQHPLGYGGLTGGAASLNRMSDLRDAVEIFGPYNPVGVSKTTSRALVFICEPKKSAQGEGSVVRGENSDESACARRITENLARRAFRRPVTAEEMKRLMPFYEAARQEGGTFDQGIEQVVAAVLVSPQFLYRSIRGPKGAHPANQPDTEFALTDLELASRLSFFLWNTGPDEELLTLAAANGLTSHPDARSSARPGALGKPGALEKQVKRMLADPRASSLVTSFAMKWLNLTDLDQVIPDPVLFPEFSDQLRRDFSTEAEDFIGSIFSDDRSVLELLTADYTFLNERLARHYGISGVAGNQFRKVSLSGQEAEKERWGLLGKGAVLLRTSYGDRTSPVLRGAWVLDKLLGTPPTPPPPDTATDLSQKAGEQPKTVRARLEQHRNKATCRMCHGVIDPTGLALENFDATGQWRTTDRQANAPIDARTVLPSGVPINGVAELRAQLVERPELFARTVTERLMMYGINRQLEYFDMPQVRAIVRGAAKDNYKVSALILGIVNSDAFRRQGAPADAKPKSNKPELTAAKNQDRDFRR
jgi:mono/diheme cytochrome c family protein